MYVTVCVLGCVQMRSLQNLTMHLRKVCNHPLLMVEDNIQVGREGRWGPS